MSDESGRSKRNQCDRNLKMRTIGTGGVSWKTRVAEVRKLKR